MNKIEYFNNCDETYLQSLGLRDENFKETQKCKDYNDKWENLQNGNSRLKKIFPMKFDELLICSYERLVESFVAFENEFPLIRILLKTEINILKFFNYDSFKEKIASFFLNNANKMSITSCYYCDAAYTGIYEYEKEEKRTFDVDHFFPNAQYPFFSLCLYNFVPSCQVCNSRVKGSKNFFELYNLKDLNRQKLKEALLEISPISKSYNISKHLNICVQPKMDTSDDKFKWHYHPEFYKNLNSYKVHFDIDESTNYKKAIEAFRLEDRYNNIGIKSQALYLMDLKKKYPDSNIELLRKLLSEKGMSFEEIKRDIFHKDNKLDLLRKMKDDIIDSDIFDSLVE